MPRTAGAPLLLLLAAAARAAQTIANVTVTDMLQCTQLEGITLRTSARALSWLDSRALVTAGTGFDCEIARAARVCWEGAFMRYLHDTAVEDFEWVREDDDIPFALAKTEPADYDAQRACASECFLLATCFPGEDITLLDPRVDLCLDHTIFSFLDAPGCRGRRLERVATMLVAFDSIERGSPAAGSVTSYANVTSLLLPALADALAWNLVDIRPLVATEDLRAVVGTDAPVVAVAFMHANAGYRVFTAGTNTFHNNAGPFTLERRLAAYVQRVAPDAPSRLTSRMWVSNTSPTGDEAFVRVNYDYSFREAAVLILLLLGLVMAIPCLLAARKYSRRRVPCASRGHSENVHAS